MASENVKLSAKGLSILNKSEIILCSSLFYFRIPRSLWKDRLKKVKAGGYNCIDVYFPWNFHETEEGVWDFKGEKDVARFLKLAAEEGLYVVARPGPYICSEWDGGALPAYLLTKPGIQLRDDNATFLSCTAKWYSKIIPILSKYQIGKEGSIILMQLDNELDFYNCTHPTEYISALRDIAIEYGMEVPLIVCAGQGDIAGAGGNAENVIPTLNFYPNDCDPNFEEKIHTYYQFLQNNNLPLCVTETNRSHFLLRRLLSSGTKLLGPYLQASGFNFGFTNAVNNWGDPLSFLTSDYDFHGMITPTGKLRKEFFEGILLGDICKTLGRSLANAVVAEHHSFEVESDHEGTKLNVLHLENGGQLIGIPNVLNEEIKVKLKNGETYFPKQHEIRIASTTCPFVLYDVPLATWGMEGTLHYATAELIQATRKDRHLDLLFHLNHNGEICLIFESEVQQASSVVSILPDQRGIVITVEDLSTIDREFDILLCDGQRFTIRLTNNVPLASRINEDQLATDLSVTEESNTLLDLDWSYAEMNAHEIPDGIKTLELVDSPCYLEDAGIYRGYAWYAGDILLESHKLKGLYLQNGSDILSVYVDKKYIGTFTPGGANEFIAVADDFTEKASIKLCVRTEIWGHSNFDDSSVPALKLDAKRGIGNIIAIVDQKQIRENWTYYPNLTDTTVLAENNNRWAVTNWGGWFSAKPISKGIYKKRLYIAKNRVKILGFSKLDSSLRMFIDGKDLGVIHPKNPYINLSTYVKDKDYVDISIYTEKEKSQTLGEIYLLEGIPVTNWILAGDNEKGFHQIEAASKAVALPYELPLTLEPGKTGWLFSEIAKGTEEESYSFRVNGNNSKVTVLVNDRLIGRLWLPSLTARPVFTGGQQNQLFIPASYLDQRQNRISIFIEAVDPEGATTINGFHFEPIVETEFLPVANTIL
ncbi:beta-galactosidase [Caldibacillus lycopersici]|uniref:Beta-galactosidase n=1 Tax=Perspicuibacillus lycopersici TaxID=1325689 RepID=A0AAE3LST2_9BACI|nr:beta-galactosidase [Perspicuibacillus lycopersici]MCU9613093.1 beta-galactosidase [Perspicuibacillus lycopersici]